jgi:hypothetical protein
MPFGHSECECVSAHITIPIDHHGGGNERKWKASQEYKVPNFGTFSSLQVRKRYSLLSFFKEKLGLIPGHDFLKKETYFDNLFCL